MATIFSRRNYHKTRQGIFVASSDRPEGRPVRPLSPWLVVALVSIGIAVAAAAMYLLLAEANKASSVDSRAQYRIDAIKTALTVGVGAGGLAVLVLSARRQWLAERDHLERNRVAKVEEHDASERRVTELYGKSVELLANPAAVVRLSALYALERLGQQNPEHRQTVANVLCGYLRMSPNSEPGPDRLEGTDLISGYGVDELEVRSTAQRIIALNLKDNNQTSGAWTDLDLDLRGAVLLDFALDAAAVKHAAFDGATFWGRTTFSGTRFESAVFDHATFRGPVSFGGANFVEYCTLDSLECLDRIPFGAARLDRGCSFADSVFWDTVEAEGIRSEGGVEFTGSEFLGLVIFRRAKVWTLSFSNCVLHDWFDLDPIEAEKVYFDDARLYSPGELGNAKKYRMIRAVIKKEGPYWMGVPDGWELIDSPNDESFAMYEASRDDI